MRNIGNFFVWFFGALVAANLVLFGVSYISGNIKNPLESINSPLPDLFTNFLTKDASASEFWEPNLLNKNTKHTFDVTALGAISYDMSTNTVLFAKNIDDRLPMASLTKIMTAVVALENMDLHEKITISKEAATIGESSMGLTVGEVLTLENLLYGLILHSGNDAAEAIAQSSKFGKDGFLFLMNKKAEDIGLSNTRFTNASGLEGDGEQYSSAKELLILTRYALQNPTFAKIVATYQHDIPESKDNKAYTLYNETNLLTTYPGVKGVKTGFTNEAGMCLVTYLEHEGHKIIAILLNSQNRRQEMKDLLDYSLLSIGLTPPPFNSRL